MLTKKFQQEYSKLNEKQKEAVEAIEGPVLVVAGPGTGKTQILAMRIANILVKTQIAPGNILCLTFTNSGVYEMKKRLLDIIGAESYKIHVHTFHSFCNEVIQTFPEKFLFANKLDQLTDLDQILLIQKILDQNDFEKLKPLKAPYYYQSAILDSIKKLKQENIEPPVLKKIVEADEKNIELAEIYAQYQTNLKKEGFYDYEDMIIFVARALKKDHELLSYYQEKFQYILIDEYQDTNSSQNEVVRLLASFYEEPNLFAVGDDEQSIFRFQGASLENILSFLKTYPTAKLVVLEDNYRSGQEILDVSRQLIENNEHQIYRVLGIPKKIISTIKSSASIQTAHFSTGSVEDFFIAQTIKKIIKKGKNPSEIACIYKEHRDAENLAETLNKLKIPFSQIKSENVLDDIEIKKILKLLEIVQNPFQDSLLFEVMHFSFWKFRPLDIYRLVQVANKSKKSLFDSLGDNNFLAKIIAKASFDFHNLTFAQAFENLINESGFLKHTLKLPDAPVKLNRLKSLFDEIKKLNIKDKNLSLNGFLKYLSELQKNNISITEELMDTSFQGVRLLTAHQAKGQEFDTVFILHLTDKHWGNKTKRELIKLPKGILKLDLNHADIEEERRLFYVGLTRAKTNLFLSFADQYRESSFSIPSQFLNELPKLPSIKVQKYEKQFAKRLELSLKKTPQPQTKKNQEFLHHLAQKFILSATSFNAYLECPQKFFYNQLLRVPRVKDFNLSYGSAVHYALEMFFKDQIKSFTLPNAQKLIDYYNDGLDREILTSEEMRRAKKQGSAVLKQYYDFFKNDWQKKIPVAAEYSFGFHNVHFGQIPVTGKIDKIEILDKNAKTVKIIDYKTSAPKSLNYLLGKTKEKDFSFLYQAFFYKLLAENDPLFSWKVGEVEFEFLSPRDNKFSKVVLPIDPKQYKEFLERVEAVYAKIQKLEFNQDLKTCGKSRFPCDYIDLCPKSN